MKYEIIEIIAHNLSIKPFQVDNTIRLLNEGGTIPFISRYRKEKTGSLDETQVLSIRDQKDKFEELENRKVTILHAIEEQGLLTSELKERITGCFDPTELEDIYLPFKPKRKTRATIARDKGLEPLAKILMQQVERDPESKALTFLNEEVETVEEALAGARDIIAEWISEYEKARNIVRKSFRENAVISSRVVKDKEEEGSKYRDYFEWKESLKKCPSHRLLAMRRGEKEGFLSVSVKPDSDSVISSLIQFFVKGNSESSGHVKMAVTDSYKRLIGPSIENEFAGSAKERADDEAIRVFADNLRQLLLAPPLGQKRVLAIDPGYRTGCKIVCLDSQGNLLHNETVYPNKPQEEYRMAAKKITSMVNAYQIEAVAIGNGTASRETENFIKKIRFDREVKVFVVSEDGASVYSASSIAREEFPSFDVTVRGAVSIGRRLMDPLAELVKIDPKSIGVGQYQHDVDQKKLKSSLDSVIESCVNQVGVNVNTASRHLLTYVSGLGPQLAQNIVDYRQEHGPFDSRSDLKKVTRMGSRSFEQSAGFLRIPDAGNPLDNSAVHPESYPIAEKIASDLKLALNEIIGNETVLQKIDPRKYVTPEAGIPTITDILKELTKPGRDPRKTIRIFEFAEGIHSIQDVHPGMILPGIVTNITRFGAFVDIGIKESGLIHISELANRYVADPNEVIKIHQHIKAKVLEVDLQRKRIQLSLKQAENQ